jgi:hypothetical protein
MGKKRRLLDEYQFPGFRLRSEIQGIFGDPRARVIRLKRTQKKRFADAVARLIADTTTRKCNRHGICPAGMPGYTWKQRSGESSAKGAEK